LGTTQRSKKEKRDLQVQLLGRQEPAICKNRPCKTRNVLEREIGGHFGKKCLGWETEKERGKHAQSDKQGFDFIRAHLKNLYRTGRRKKLSGGAKSGIRGEGASLMSANGLSLLERRVRTGRRAAETGRDVNKDSYSRDQQEKR